MTLEGTAACFACIACGQKVMGGVYINGTGPYCQVCDPTTRTLKDLKDMWNDMLSNPQIVLPLTEEDPPVITVSIFINGKPIITRSARNTGRTRAEGSQPQQTAYQSDDGNIVWHNPKLGAVVLAKALLDRVVEP